MAHARKQNRQARQLERAAELERVYGVDGIKLLPAAVVRGFVHHGTPVPQEYPRKADVQLIKQNIVLHHIIRHPKP